jgi:hypothetical protein
MPIDLSAEKNLPVAPAAAPKAPAKPTAKKKAFAFGGKC